MRIAGRCGSMLVSGEDGSTSVFIIFFLSVGSPTSCPRHAGSEEQHRCERTILTAATVHDDEDGALPREFTVLRRLRRRR